MGRLTARPVGVNGHSDYSAQAVGCWLRSEASWVEWVTSCAFSWDAQGRIPQRQLTQVQAHRRRGFRSGVCCPQALLVMASGLAGSLTKSSPAAIAGRTRLQAVGERDTNEVLMLSRPVVLRHIDVLGSVIRNAVTEHHNTVIDRHDRHCKPDIRW
jgi:hypothetical protein